MIHGRHIGLSGSTQLSGSTVRGSSCMDSVPEHDFGGQGLEDFDFEDLVGAEVFTEDDLEQLAAARALSQDGESAG